MKDTTNYTITTATKIKATPMECFFDAQYKKRHLIMNNSDEKINYLQNSFNDIVLFIKNIFKEKAKKINFDDPSFPARFILYIVIDLLQKIIAIEDSKKVYYQSLYINNIRTDQFDMMLKYIRSILPQEYIKIIKEFNDISIFYNHNITNFFHPYTVELKDLETDTIDNFIKYFGQNQFEKLNELFIPILFASVDFLEPDFKIKKTSFKYKSTFDKYDKSLNLFSSGIIDENTIKFLKKICHKPKHSLHDNVTKSRLLGLWLWDQRYNPYIEKIGSEEDINNRALEFYYGQDFLQNKKLFEMSKENIKILKNNSINNNTRRGEEKINNKLTIMKQNFEVQKSYYQHKIDYVINDILKITNQCIEKMKVIRFRNEK